MSGTRLTAEQPALHTDNITAHPGSTWAGVGVVLTGVAQAVASGGVPSSVAGWLVLGLQVGAGVLGMLGK